MNYFGEIFSVFLFAMLLLQIKENYFIKKEHKLMEEIMWIKVKRVAVLSKELKRYERNYESRI